MKALNSIYQYRGTATPAYALLLVACLMFSSCKPSDDVDNAFGSDDTTTTTITTTTGDSDSDNDSISLTAIGGNFQNVAPSTSVSSPLRVQVLNGTSPVSAVSVNWSIVSGAGGTFSASSSTTDSSGIASILFTSSATAGSVTVRANYLGFYADFTITVIDQTGKTLALVSGNSQSSAVGTSVTNPLLVRVTDTGTGLAASGILVNFNVIAGNGRINGTSNSTSVTTDGSGLASINFTSGTTMGTNTIRASLAADPTELADFTITGTVASGDSVSASQTTITSSSATLQADGSNTALITLTINDAYGNQIPNSGKTVVLSTNTGTMLGSVAASGGSPGVYTQSVRVPANTNTNPMVISGTVNAVAMTDTASVALSSGSYSTATSTVTTASSTVAGDGSSTTLVTVTLKDTLGNTVLSGGETVVISTTLGTLIGSVSDNGDGTYTQNLRAPSSVGSATVSATVNAAGITDTASVSFTAGTAVAANTVMVVTPSTIPPDGTSTTNVVVSLYDTNNNPLSIGGDTVVLSTTNGTFQSSGTTTVTPTDNGNGSYTGVLVAPAASGQATVSATVNSSAATDTELVYFSNSSSAPSTVYSQIEVDTTYDATYDSVIPADGSTTAQIKLTLKDSSNQSIDACGHTISISTTAGTMLGSAGGCSADGTYTQLIRSSGSATASVTVSASVNGDSIDDTATLSFYGAMSVSTSTIEASPSLIQADGSSQSILLIQAKDANSIIIPVGGEIANLAISTSNGTWATALSDNNNGTYSRTLTAPGAAGSASITATLSAVGLSDTATVTFLGAGSVITGTYDCSNVAGIKNTDVVIDGTTVYFNTHGSAGSCPNDFVFSSVTIQNSGSISQSTNTASDEFGIEFTTDFLQIESGSSISVSSRTQGSSTTDRFISQANLQIRNNPASGNCYAGGSYGGRGAVNGSSHYSNLPYGNIFTPYESGTTGCKENSGWDESRGGGRVKITISNNGTLLNNGGIYANGQNHWNGTSHLTLGSGGSIWIDTYTLKGTGVISANGGTSHASQSTGGIIPGGGGRIAIYYNNLEDDFTLSNITNSVTTYGGEDTQSSNDTATVAAAGTIYLKGTSQTYGDLIIKNRDVLPTTTSNLYAKTLLIAPSIGVPSNLTSTVLTKASTFEDSHVSTSPYVGWYINPNTTQNATETLTDDTVFKITSATSNDITISSGNMLSIANGSQNAELMLIFDNFEVSGKAFVESDAPILVLEGDVSSDDTSTAVVNGALPERLEYSGSVTLAYDLEGLSQNSTYGQFANSSANLNLSNGTLSFSGSTIKGANVSFSNSFTSSGYPIIEATGDVTVDASSGSIGSISTTGDITFNNSSSITMGQLVGTDTINSSGGSLILAGGSVLAQRGTSTSNEYSLEIDVQSLSVGAGSTLHSSRAGYDNPSGSGSARSRSYGNQYVLSFSGTSTYQSGGSHGGRGGHRWNSLASGETYGNLFNPYTSGASGGYSASGDGGGGIVRINTNGGSAIVNGTIHSNAYQHSSTTNYQRTYGAGGSVYLNVGALSGTGTIAANGGNWGCYEACGGGGRVAIYYTSAAGNFSWPSNAQTYVTAFGGTDDNTNQYDVGGAGTVFFKKSTDTYGKLVVKNRGYDYINSGYEAYTHIDMPASSTSTTVSATQVNKAGAFGSGLLNSASAPIMSNQLVGFLINPDLNDTGTTSVLDDTYYTITSQDSDSVTTAGDMTSIATNGDTYNVAVRFDEVYVSGAGVLSTDGLIITNKLVIDDGRLEGDGTIAITGDGGVSLTDATLNLTTVDLAPTSSASVTLDNTSYSFPRNTVISGDLTIDNGASASSYELNIGGDLNIQGGGNLTSGIEGTLGVSSTHLVVGGDVNLTESSTLQSRHTNTSQEYYLNMQADNISVEAGSSIHAVGAGMRNLNRYYYRVPGNIDVRNEYSDSNRSCGAAHGGKGGCYSTSETSNSTYGSIFEPIQLGASSHCENSSSGCSADGGGAIKINVTDTLTVNGTINASAASTGYQMRGAGGSVYITTASIGGTGNILADGSSYNSAYYAGGGGRVAVYYTSGSGDFADSNAMIGNVTAYGGYSTNAGRNGSAGTVFIKQAAQNYGDLIIDNNSYSLSTGASKKYTQMYVPTNQVSSALTASLLSSSTATNFVAQYLNHIDMFKGLWMDPDISENGTDTLADDTFYPITSNTNDTVTINTAVNGDMTDVATAGDTWAPVLILDNLEIVNNGGLHFDGGRIYVESGDISSEDSACFVQDGYLVADVVDLNTAEKKTTGNSAGSISTLVETGSACP